MFGPYQKDECWFGHCYEEVGEDYFYFLTLLFLRLFYAIVLGVSGLESED